jgi:RsiW-degrading membrane proteinase PrsW (M82 family)
VAGCAPYIAVVVLASVFAAPVAALLVVPVAVGFAGVVVWLVRLTPEPRPALWWAAAWGAVVATTVAAEVNGLVAPFGDLAVAAVSAPLVEEALKAVPLLVLWRLGVLRSPFSGAVYALAVAAGFTVVEDLVYLAAAFEGGGSGDLATTFVLRSVFTPLTHPLFTVVVGLAVGWAAARRRSAGVAGLALVAGALGGAVMLHAGWNVAVLAFADQPLVFAVAVLAAFATLAVVAVAVVLAARRSAASAAASTAAVSAAGLPGAAAELLGAPRRCAAERRRLPADRRAAFDALRWEAAANPTTPDEALRAQARVEAAYAALVR